MRLSINSSMLFFTAAVAAVSSSNLVITGIIDGPLTGGLPKAIELYVLADIADLSVYGVGSANNGGGTDGEEFTLSGSASAGDFIYIASEDAGFTTFFGFEPTFTSSAALSINGDDAIELFLNGAVVDVFGEIDTDGTGEPWEHLDGWAYRNDGTGPDGSTFVLDSWSFSGPNALDDETTNAAAETPFPIGTYNPSELVITGIIDGPLTGGLPKAIELYVLTDIADLSVYGVGSANNGGGTGGVEFTLSGSASAGEFIYVASESTGFTTFFGFAPTLTSVSALSINGDDAIELFFNGAVVDVFGEIDTDGTGEPWEHLDGWAYRNDGTGPDGSTFVLDSWSFSGPNALDDETTNAAAETPFPIGTYNPSELVITGVIDGPLTGGLPKAIELYALADIADLSVYGVGSANNGGGTGGVEFTLSGSASAGEFIYVASESTGFTTFFGFAPTLTSVSALSINGDDAIELFLNGAVVDVFGEIDTDGTGEPWEHLDGWAYRNDGTGPDGSTFVLDSWSFSGPNALDGETTNAAAETPFPIGTYNSTFSIDGSENPTEPPTEPPTEEVILTLISEIQGNGTESPLEGETVAIEGIVVGDFQEGQGESGDLNGFFVQEEDSDVDDDTSTSEGIFVFDGSSQSAVDVSIGDIVQVIGVVEEYFGNTEISEVVSVTVINSGNVLPSPTTISLPVNDVLDFEKYEGMLVTLYDGSLDTDELTIVEYFQFGRFGQIQLAASGYPVQFTQTDAPNSDGYAEHLTEVERRTIFYDDGRSDQNPAELFLPGTDILYTTDNSFRGGDKLSNVIGCLQYSFSEWRIQPTTAPELVRSNPRPNVTDFLDSIGGRIKIASFNVLNFFTTIDESDNLCGPEETLDCRGADDEEEYNRQLEKLLSAFIELKADIFGLMEIENSENSTTLSTLVNELNSVLDDEDEYDFVNTGFIGSDAIAVAFIYKKQVIEAVGDFVILDSTIDSTFIDTKNRPVLIQTFKEISTDEILTAAVNHFKSKGSDCSDVGDPDPSPDDGTASCDLTRTNAALALVNFLLDDPTGSNDPDFLILGDLNSYAMESPIQTILEANYTNLALKYNEDAYGYVFDGQRGTLDYMLANFALEMQVTWAAEWHINADEPNALDYDTTFDDENHVDPFDGSVPFRSSDHDLVVVGLNLASSSVPPTISPTLAPTIDIIEFTTSQTFYVPETTPNIDTNDAAAIFELICADDAVEEVLVNYTKEAFESDAGPLGDTVIAECDIENSTDASGPTGSVPVEFVCTIEMYRRDAQQPPTGSRTSSEARDLLLEIIVNKVNGTNEVGEVFVDDFVAALQSNPDSDCTDDLALSVAELLNLTVTITSRRLQFSTFLAAIEEGEVADTVEVDVETSSPTSAPSFIPTLTPTFIPTVTTEPTTETAAPTSAPSVAPTLKPTFTPTVTAEPTTETGAPTGQNCRYDSDCPPGQSCEGATRRFRKRKLQFGYSSGECK